MAPSISQLRLIPVFMILGMAGFAGFAVWYTTTYPPAPSASATIFWVFLGGLALAELVAYFVVRTTLISRLQRQHHTDVESDMTRTGLHASYLALTLIGTALAEGLGLFAAIVLFLFGDLRLIVIVAASIGAILAMLPSENRFRAFAYRITGTWPTTT